MKELKEVIEQQMRNHHAGYSYKCGRKYPATIRMNFKSLAIYAHVKRIVRNKTVLHFEKLSYTRELSSEPKVWGLEFWQIDSHDSLRYSHFTSLTKREKAT